MSLEVVLDQQVAGAARREQRGAFVGEAPVVDEPGPLRRLDRVAADAGRRAAVVEPLLERGGRMVTSPQRPQRAIPRASSRRSSRPRARADGRSSGLPTARPAA